MPDRTPNEGHGSTVISRSVLEAGRSRNGGWSDAQLKLLGVPYPLRQGWKRRLYGTRVPAPDLEAFLSLKDDHLPQQDDADSEADGNIVAFVYLVLRDHLTSSVVERLVEQIVEAPQLDREYSDTFTHEHAIDLAERLLGLT